MINQILDKLYNMEIKNINKYIYVDIYICIFIERQAIDIKL